jgi:hypothetical protein
MIKTTYLTIILETPTYVILLCSSLYTLILKFRYTTLQQVVGKVTRILGSQFHLAKSNTTPKY